MQGSRRGWAAGDRQSIIRVMLEKLGGWEKAALRVQRYRQAPDVPTGSGGEELEVPVQVAAFAVQISMTRRPGEHRPERGDQGDKTSP